MQLLKTKMTLDDKSEHLVDTIEYEGKTWIIPHWFENTVRGTKIPTRIVAIDALPHKKNPSGSPDGDFVVTAPFPKAVFDGYASEEMKTQFDVIDRPSLKFPI
jgi:hypothetical protein